MQYSEEDIKKVVEYAGPLGIDVVIELDVPAHSAAIGESHPEHVACFHKSPSADYSNEPPAGQLRLDAATQNFTSNLFKALMKNVKSSYMHQGGDEPNAACYVSDLKRSNQCSLTNLPLSLGTRQRYPSGSQNSRSHPPECI